MGNEHIHVIASASSGLSRAAHGLGAEFIAVLEAAGCRVRVTCFWSRLPHQAPERRFLESRRLLTDALTEGVVKPSGSASALAELLRDSISEQSQSFLLFPLPGGENLSAGVIGFAAPNAPVSQVPDAVVENLNLLGWAASSADEIARLRVELKNVNERLAGRKLVERAKSALQAEQSITEEQAYEYLRSVSRKRRITLTALSAEILGARAGGNQPEFLAAGRQGSVV